RVHPRAVAGRADRPLPRDLRAPAGVRAPAEPDCGGTGPGRSEDMNARVFRFSGTLCFLIGGGSILADLLLDARFHLIPLAAAVIGGVVGWSLTRRGTELRRLQAVGGEGGTETRRGPADA